MNVKWNPKVNPSWIYTWKLPVFSFQRVSGLYFLKNDDFRPKILQVNITIVFNWRTFIIEILHQKFPYIRNSANPVIERDDGISKGIFHDIVIMKDRSSLMQRYLYIVDSLLYNR